LLSEEGVISITDPSEVINKRKWRNIKNKRIENKGSIKTIITEYDCQQI
jgi:hypothetical protein